MKRALSFFKRRFFSGILFLAFILPVLSPLFSYAESLENSSFGNFSTQGAAPLRVAGQISGVFNSGASVNLQDAILALQVLTGMNPPGIPLNYTTSGVGMGGINKIGFPEMIFMLQFLAGLRPEQSGGTLQGKFSLSTAVGGLAADSLLVQLEGTNFSAKPGNDGAFTISDIPEGVYTLLAESNSDPSYKFRTDLIIKNGEMYFLGNIDLTKTGSVSGVATIEGSLDNLGIDVYLAGTSFLARTAGDGSYRIYYVPVGVYTLVVDFPGYQRAIVDGVEVKTGEDTVVKTIVLKKETPISGGSIDGVVYSLNGSGNKSPLAKAAVSLYMSWANEECQWRS